MGWIKLTIHLMHERRTKVFIKPISQYITSYYIEEQNIFWFLETSHMKK